MPSNLQYALYGILALLVVGTVVIGLKRMFKPGSGAPELWLRMRSWWVMAGLFIMAIAVNRTLSIVFFALVSFLALKEYFSIIPTRRADRRGLFWAYLAIPLQYFWVAEAWFGMFIIFIPVYLFLFIPLKMVIVGETQGFLKAAGTLHWGLMTAVFSLSHAAFLLSQIARATCGRSSGRIDHSSLPQPTSPIGRSTTDPAEPPAMPAIGVCVAE